MAFLNSTGLNTLWKHMKDFFMKLPSNDSTASTGTILKKTSEGSKWDTDTHSLNTGYLFRNLYTIPVYFSYDATTSTIMFSDPAGKYASMDFPTTTGLRTEYLELFRSYELNKENLIHFRVGSSATAVRLSAFTEEIIKLTSTKNYSLILYVTVDSSSSVTETTVTNFLAPAGASKLASELHLLVTMDNGGSEELFCDILVGGECVITNDFIDTDHINTTFDFTLTSESETINKDFCDSLKITDYSLAGILDFVQNNLNSDKLKIRLVNETKSTGKLILNSILYL